MVVGYVGVDYVGEFEQAVAGELEGLFFSALLWSVLMTFILYGRYDISFLTALILSPVVVVGGAVLVFGGAVVLFQLLVALLVPALVLLFVFGWIPLSVSSSS